MKNFNYLAIVAAFALFVGVAVMPSGDAFAAPKGNAWGYYGMAPGQMKHTYRYQYGPYWFEDREEWLEYIREYIRMWRELRGLEVGTSVSGDIRVTTGVATDIDEDEATVHGTLDLRNDDEATVWFEYGTQVNSLTKSTTKEEVDEDGTYEADLTGLSDDTRYYFRFVGKDEDGDKHNGAIRTFTTDEDGSDDDSDDDAEDDPSATTRTATNVDDDGATLRGTVDMNDFDNGTVFFVYGEDEDMVEDVEDDFDTYEDIDESGDDLRKVKMDSDLDSDAAYEYTLSGLDDNTTYHFAVGVAYEDEDGDETIVLGKVLSFTLGDADGDEDEPTASTLSAQNVDADGAKLRGTVDMQDFDNGVVFFVYGTDEDMVEDVADEFTTYDDIDEDGDNLQKFKVDADLDSEATYEYTVSGLDDDRTYYYAIGVAYEDEDNDDVIVLGDVRSFATEEE